MRRRWSTRVFLCVGLFVALLGLSAIAYPGGTWDDHGTIGVHLADNFLCDLLLPVAINGEPNPIGGFAARGAMLALSAGIVLALFHVPLGPSTGRRWVRGLAAAAVPGMVLVALAPITPGAPWVELHAVGVFLGGAPALLAGAIAVVMMRRRRWVAAVGAVMFLTTTIAIATYGVYLTTPADDLMRLLAYLQRPSVVLLVAWLVAVAVEIRRDD